MSLITADYDYALPPELIAKYPAQRREDARMMVLYRNTKTVQHHLFRCFPAFVRSGDLVVLNDTKVIPARLFSVDGRIELLLIEQIGNARWKSFVKPGRKMRVGTTIPIAGTTARVESVLSDGSRVIVFAVEPDLEKFGVMPLPPYIGRPVESADHLRYQTVYAAELGAVAAPTAGLHFTSEILAQVPHSFVTLHVGPGTFRPVKTDRLDEHEMHQEKFTVRDKAALEINSAKRIIAVGTTTVRVLESCADAEGNIVPQTGSTCIFIWPPYRFRRVAALLTNFHLPRSTLLMLVAAFAGREFILHAYAEAVRARYRFYSYGDCMLIL